MRFLTKFADGFDKLVDFITTFTGVANQGIQTNSSGFVDASLIPSGAGLPLGTTNGDIITWDGSQWIATRPRLSWVWTCYRQSALAGVNTMRRTQYAVTTDTPFIAPLNCRIKTITAGKADSDDYTLTLFVNGALDSSYIVPIAPQKGTTFLNVDIDLVAGDEVYMQCARIGGGNVQDPIAELFVQEAYSTELLNR